MHTREYLINTPLPKEGGIYKWYVTKEGANQLSIPIDGCLIKNEMYLIYIGLSKNLNQRLKWHADDKHRISSIKSGTLSVLRQKLCALLYSNWSNKEGVDNFMNSHMRVEFEVNPNYEKDEKQLIKEHVLPLNVRHNNHPFRKTLSKINSQAKKNSLNELYSHPERLL